MTISTDPVITPNDLKFRFTLNKQLPTHITINNPSEQRMAFKVKTTTPKKYCVKPSSGVIESGSSSVVHVIMQAQKETPPDFNNCKDKFLVQTVVLNAGEEVTQETFKKELRKDVKEAKLRVILEGPAAPPSPVPEANEGEEEPPRERSSVPINNVSPVVHSSSEVRLKDDLADATAKYNQLKSRYESVQREKEQLKNKLDSLELRSPGITSNGPISFARSQDKSASKWALIQLLVVAILAFLIGHYT